MLSELYLVPDYDYYGESFEHKLAYLEHLTTYGNALGPVGPRRSR